jgi:hypothetical protein
MEYRREAHCDGLKTLVREDLGQCRRLVRQLVPEVQSNPMAVRVEPSEHADVSGQRFRYHSVSPVKNSFCSARRSNVGVWAIS